METNNIKNKDIVARAKVVFCRQFADGVYSKRKETIYCLFD